MTTLQAQERWNLPDAALLEQAWELAERLEDPELTACIQTLAWRLTGSLEWIEARSRR